MNPHHPLLRYFAYEHLPPHLQNISRPFGELAEAIARDFPVYDAAEGEAALRKLLEAKDAAVRSTIQPRN